MLLLCYAVTSFRGRNMSLLVFVFNYVYAVNKLVLIFEYTYISSYYLLDVLARIVRFMASWRMFGVLCCVLS
jgi:hypothetical protein